jgi:ElaB/YqjD/DUF883 family membrane-anchored ribosome-binding protein
MPDTQEIKDTLQRELDALSQARDELKLKLHLAKAEAKTEWNKLESTWQRVQEEFQHTKSGAEQPLRDMGKAAKTLLEELRNGYARVREQLKEHNN